MAAMEVLHTQGIRVTNRGQHACKVIIPGRSFLRRAITHLSVAKKKHHHIRLNNEFKLTWHGGKSSPHIGMEHH